MNEQPFSQAFAEQMEAINRSQAEQTSRMKDQIRALSDAAGQASTAISSVLDRYKSLSLSSRRGPTGRFEGVNGARRELSHVEKAAKRKRRQAQRKARAASHRRK